MVFSTFFCLYYYSLGVDQIVQRIQSNLKFLVRFKQQLQLTFAKHYETCLTSLPPVSMHLQVPYEALNRRFRNAQKNIDREVQHVTTAANTIETALDDDPSTEAFSEMLGSFVAKLKVLKRKVISTSCNQASNRVL